MMAVNLEAMASYSSMRLVDSLAEGLAVGLFAALLLRFSRRQNAGTRFAIGFSALLAIALLSLARGLWPHSRLSSAAPAVVVPESWALYLFSAWAVIAILLLARVSRSVWHLHQLRNACVPLDAACIDPLVADTLKRKQTWRKVALCTSEKVRVPTALGFFRPAIVIPRWLLQELSAGELNQILLHELAHLRRWDDWTNLAQQIVKALFFFHPAVWWIERKISLEREMACDDAVVAETASPRAYAECLANLAEKTFVQRSIALAQAALGRIRHTSMRVARILDGSPAGAKHGWTVAVALVAVFAGACAIAGAKAPRLITFTDGVSANSIASSRVDSGVSNFSIKAAPVTLREPAPAVHSAALRAKPTKHVVHRMKRNDAPLIAQLQAPPIEEILHLAKLSPVPLIPAQTV